MSHKSSNRITVAHFKVFDTFYITNRGFYIAGEIIDGKVSKGNFVVLPDKTFVEITGIEFLDIRSKRQSYVALATKKPTIEILPETVLEIQYEKRS